MVTDVTTEEGRLFHNGIVFGNNVPDANGTGRRKLSIYLHILSRSISDHHLRCWVGAKAALKTASRQREQQTRDSEKGETAAPKGLESLAPFYFF